MKIAVVADYPDDPRRKRAAELERDLRCGEARECVGDESGIEGDRRGLALNGCVDAAGVVADLGRVRGDDEWRLVRGVDLESQHVRGVACEVRRKACRLQKLLALGEHPCRVACGDDLLVVGELPLDDPRDQVGLVGVKNDLALVRSHEDVDRTVLGIFEDPCDLEEAFCGDDHLDRRVHSVKEARVSHRQSVWVGSRHRDEVTGEGCEDARKDWSAVVRRRDERDLANHPAKRPLRHAGGGLLRDLGDDRKLFRIHAFDVGLVGTGLDVDRLRPHVQRELDIPGRKRVHEIDEELGRHRDGAFVIHLCRDPAVDPNLEVGRSEAQTTGIGTEENVAKDRQAPPGRNSASRDPQPMREVLL